MKGVRLIGRAEVVGIGRGNDDDLDTAGVVGIGCGNDDELDTAGVAEEERERVATWVEDTDPSEVDIFAETENESLAVFEDKKLREIEGDVDEEIEYVPLNWQRLPETMRLQWHTHRG